MRSTSATILTAAEPSVSAPKPGQNATACSYMITLRGLTQPRKTLQNTAFLRLCQGLLSIPYFPNLFTMTCQHSAYSLRLVTATVVILLIAPWCASGQEIAFPTKDTLAEWQAYLNFSRSIQGTMKRVHTSTSDTKPATTAWSVLKQNGSCALLRQSGHGSNNAFVRLTNPLYTAELVVAAKRIDIDTWLLRSYALGPTGRIRPSDDAVGDQVFWCTSPHVTFYYTTLPELFSRKSFTVQKIGPDGAEGLKVDFQHSTQDAKEQYSVRNGVMYLKRTGIWYISSIEEEEVVYRGGKKHSTLKRKHIYDVHLHSAGFPLARGWVVNYAGNTEPGNRTVAGTISYQGEWVIKDDEPESEFYLSAFGLPEPIGVLPPGRSNRPIWLVTAAVMVGGVALYLARRRQGIHPART